MKAAAFCGRSDFFLPAEQPQQPAFNFFMPVPSRTGRRLQTETPLGLVWHPHSFSPCGGCSRPWNRYSHSNLPQREVSQTRCTRGRMKLKLSCRSCACHAAKFEMCRSASSSMARSLLAPNNSPPPLCRPNSVETSLRGASPRWRRVSPEIGPMDLRGSCS